MAGTNEPVRQDVGPYFTAYRKLGLTPIPLVFRTKVPPKDFSLETYFDRQPTDEEIASWSNAGNIGLVCQRNLICWDVDHRDLWDWLWKSPEIVEKIFGKTWCVRSGSGKGGHTWLWTNTPLPSTLNLTLPNKVHAGEVRGAHAYVVAPPSIHESGAAYSTVSGSPANILRVPDALKLVHAILDRYSQDRGLGPFNGTGSSPSPQAKHLFGMRILPPSDGSLWQGKWSSLKSKTRRALEEPALAGSGEWVTYPSNSEIREMIIGDMFRSGWTLDEAEQAFADLPFGEYHYRNTHTNPHGRYVLDTDWAKVSADKAREDEAAQKALGPGWRIVKVRRRQSDDPIYTLFFVLDDGREFEAAIKVEHMLQEKQFQGAVARACGWTPQLSQVHYGRNITLLMGAICDMAEDEPIPEIATLYGYLRSVVIGVLGRTEKTFSPDTRGIGWRDQTHVYVRGSLLVSSVQAVYRGATVQSVADTLQKMKAVASRISTTDGTRETIWKLPLAALTE